MAKFQAIICHRSFVEIKVLGLRYVAGAIHGKSLKRKTTKNDDKREKTKKCSESWGMGAEGFRRAPMMQQKLTTLTRTELNPKHTRRVKT